MIKIKINDVAKDFEVPSKILVDMLAKYIQPAKKGASTLEPDELDMIFDFLTTENSVDSFDTYFATAITEKPEAATPKKKEEPQEVQGGPCWSLRNIQR